MKTFEEKWTAWIDGELAGDELAQFEASLPDRATAEAEKRSCTCACASPPACSDVVF